MKLQMLHSNLNQSHHYITELKAQIAKWELQPANNYWKVRSLRKKLKKAYQEHSRIIDQINRESQKRLF